MHCLPQFQKTLILVFKVIVQTPKTHFMTSDNKIMKITHSETEQLHFIGKSKHSQKSRNSDQTLLGSIFVKILRQRSNYIVGYCLAYCFL